MAGCRKLSTGGRALIFNDDEVAALLKGELNVRALNPLLLDAMASIAAT